MLLTLDTALVNTVMAATEGVNLHCTDFFLSQERRLGARGTQGTIFRMQSEAFARSLSRGLHFACKPNARTGAVQRH